MTRYNLNSVDCNWFTCNWPIPADFSYPSFTLLWISVHGISSICQAVTDLTCNHSFLTNTIGTKGFVTVS